MKPITAAIAALLAGGVFAEMEQATPESQGVDSQGILDFIDAAERTFCCGDKWHTYGHFHGFVVVRHGKVIAEGSWKPFDTLNETHMLYSHSKSFTSTAIGFLVDEGRIDLDERLADIFPEDVPENAAEGIREIRVRDLLTMNVGSDLNHDVARSANWRKRFFERKLDRKPGTGFKYDSDATYMLACIVERRTGKKLMDFLKERLFAKIGIEKAWSTVSPQDTACGGWGMNMTTRELARFGQFYLQHGTWKGEHILSPYWVSLATARHTWSGWQKVGAQRLGEGSDWEQGYGFQFWRCTHGAYRADGAAGQLTVVMPEQDMVVSVHAGLGDMQKELNLLWDHLLPACKPAPLPENAALQTKLAQRLATLEIKPIDNILGVQVAGDCLGKTIALKDNSRGFTTVGVDLGKGLIRIGTPAGLQTVPFGVGEWRQGEMRVDTVSYEALGGYPSVYKTMASGGVQPDGALKVRIYLTGTTGFIDFNFKKSVTGEFWAMGGCKFESK